MNEGQQIQDELYQACKNWLNLYTDNAPYEDKRKAQKVIWSLWKQRAIAEVDRGNTNLESFPNPKDHIPPAHWKNGSVTYDAPFLEFVGAITSYIEAKERFRGG